MAKTSGTTRSGSSSNPRGMGDNSRNYVTESKLRDFYDDSVVDRQLTDFGRTQEGFALGQKIWRTRISATKNTRIELNNGEVAIVSPTTSFNGRATILQGQIRRNGEFVSDFRSEYERGNSYDKYMADLRMKEWISKRVKIFK